jgi:hypothetical protein
MSKELQRWSPWPEILHYKVAMCVQASWAGSGYVFARRRGQIMHFFTKGRAQAYADKLNAAIAQQGGEGDGNGS